MLIRTSGISELSDILNEACSGCGRSVRRGISPADLILRSGASCGGRSTTDIVEKGVAIVQWSR